MLRSIYSSVYNEYMTTTTVTYAQRRKMSNLIDTLQYPSRRKVQLVEASQIEGFIESYPENSVATACLNLFTTLDAYGAVSDEFEAAYTAWTATKEA